MYLFQQLQITLGLQPFHSSGKNSTSEHLLSFVFMYVLYFVVRYTVHGSKQ